MKRDEFLTTLGIGFTAVCTGCLYACGSKSDDPTPSGGGGGVIDPPTNSTLTANLDTDLLNVGDTKAGGGIIVVRLATGNNAASFTAVQQACTHEGFSINYFKNQGQFVCPNHGSTFSNSGAVITGPATLSLQKYPVVINGSTLTVST